MDGHTTDDSDYDQDLAQQIPYIANPVIPSSSAGGGEADILGTSFAREGFGALNVEMNQAEPIPRSGSAFINDAEPHRQTHAPPDREAPEEAEDEAILAAEIARLQHESARLQ